MDVARLAAMSATDAVRSIAEGALSSEELVRACLERCAAVEPQVQAWAFLDHEFALSQAQAADVHAAPGAAG